MKKLLREKRSGEHELYTRLRDLSDAHTVERRKFIQDLWSEYEPYAPKGFPKKLQIEFHQRWWEMYLTVGLLRLGFAPKQNKKDEGPDVIFDVDERQVVIEAVAPRGGRGTDRVPDPIHEGVADLPERECLLRLTNALNEKRCKIQEYFDTGVILWDSCTIIALSSTDLNQFGTLLDTVHPTPLSILAGAGPLAIRLNDNKPLYHSKRSFLYKHSGSDVNAALFQDPEFSIISGVIYSSVDLWNAPLQPEDTMSLFVNPSARVKMPYDLQRRLVHWKKREETDRGSVWKKITPS